MDNEVRKISKHIENHYELIGLQPGEVIIGGMLYDFRKISKAAADVLYATDNGKKYLKKIESKASTAKADK